MDWLGCEAMEEEVRGTLGKWMRSSGPVLPGAELELELGEVELELGMHDGELRMEVMLKTYWRNWLVV